jgi:hypothetical protein
MHSRITCSILFTLLPTAVVSAQNCKLSGDVTRISVAVGGAQQLAIDVGPANAGLYFVLGSTSGTTPGFDLGLHYPLNIDQYLVSSWVGDLRLGAAGGIGFTDAAGNATFDLSVPPGSLSAFAGLTLHHAVAPLSSVTLLHTCVTNPVRLQLVP